MLSRTTRVFVLASLICTNFARAQEKSILLALDDAQIAAAQVSNAKVTRGSGESILLSAENDSPASVSFTSADNWPLKGNLLAAQVKNVSKVPVSLRLTITNDGAHQLTDSCQMPVLLAPGESKTLELHVIQRPKDPTYEPFKPFMMYFKNINVRDNSVDAKAIKTIRFSIDRAQSGMAVEIEPIYQSGKISEDTPPFFPFIDRYGQYIHSDWPGKIRSDEDFKTRREEEARERADWKGPKNWDEYGGWANGPKLEATGHFRVTKHEGKWWFVDPLGHLFWSYGPTGVGMGGDLTPVSERENWFLGLPAQDDPAWAGFYKKGHGATYRYYQDKDWVGYDIARSNLVRKYGPEYESIVPSLSHERLRSWGFNTMANWSDSRIYLERRTPYTVAIHAGGGTSMRASDGHSIQDVYDPAWEPALIARLEQERGNTADDPWNLGYFIDNERSIGWRPRAAAIGELALKAAPTQPAKLKFIETLKSKYDSIDKLNSAWQTDYASWDALLASKEPPAFKSKEGKENTSFANDCGDFGMTFCERYFSVSRDAVKRVAPNTLFLGSRFYGHTDPEVVKLAGKYWDVISYNIYDNPPVGRVNQYNALDLPIMSTEWGVKSDPFQTPFRGESLDADPGERSRLIEQYVKAALAHPNLVGAHFFQYRDQPTSGRPDGEGTLRGFVNIVDTPNFELVQTNRRLGYSLYETRATTK